MYPDTKGVRSENSNIRKVLLDIVKKRAQPKKVIRQNTRYIKEKMKKTGD